MNLLKKNMKGITLVALIITIIVLLILAVVAIGIVRGDGILFHAKDATSKYEKDAAEENSAFKSYADMMVDEAGKGPWTQEGMNITDGHISLKVGDKVNYDERSNGEKSYSIDYTQNGGASEEKNQAFKTEDLEWRVLGVNTNGQLELISNKPTTTTLFLKGEIGYLNAKTIMNEACDTLYGQGEYVAKGRSLSLEDVLKLANYRPTIENTNYGQEWEYRFSTETGHLQSRKALDGGKSWSEWEDITNDNTQTFKIPGKNNIISKNNPGTEKVTHSYFSLSLQYLVKDVTTYNEDLKDLITKGEGGSGEIEQWLASDGMVRCTDTATGFRMSFIKNPGINAAILWFSYGSSRRIFLYDASSCYNQT